MSNMYDNISKEIYDTIKFIEQKYMGTSSPLMCDKIDEFFNPDPVDEYLVDIYNKYDNMIKECTKSINILRDIRKRVETNKGRYFGTLSQYNNKIIDEEWLNDIKNEITQMKITRTNLKNEYNKILDEYLTNNNCDNAHRKPTILSFGVDATPTIEYRETSQNITIGIQNLDDRRDESKMVKNSIQ